MGYIYIFTISSLYYNSNNQFSQVVALLTAPDFGVSMPYVR